MMWCVKLRPRSIVVYVEFRCGLDACDLVLDAYVFTWVGSLQCPSSVFVFL